MLDKDKMEQREKKEKRLFQRDDRESKMKEQCCCRGGNGVTRHREDQREVESRGT